MARLKTIAALLVLGTGLAACNGSSGEYRPDPNRSLYSVHQPVVQRTEYVLDLNAQDGALSAQERARLDAWFASLDLGYGDRLWVDEPYGPSQSRDDVARVAAEYGLLLSDGAPVTAGQVQPGSIRVVVSRSTASVPSCPDWDEGPYGDGPSSTSRNYGCATNSNLAAMVADPSDLVLGDAGSGTADARTTSKAIKVYREAVPTGTKGLASERTGGK